VKSAAFTVCVNPEEVLPVLFGIAPIDGAIECCPPAKNSMSCRSQHRRSACPCPVLVAPSMNVTVPVGAVTPRRHCRSKRYRRTDMEGFALDAKGVVVVVAALRL